MWGKLAWSEAAPRFKNNLVKILSITFYRSFVLFKENFEYTYPALKHYQHRLTCSLKDSGYLCYGLYRLLLSSYTPVTPCHSRIVTILVGMACMFKYTRQPLSATPVSSQFWWGVCPECLSRLLKKILDCQRDGTTPNESQMRYSQLLIE